MRRLLAILLVSVLSLAGLERSYAAPISYVYDELGRLIAVIDHTGDLAAYTYDSVGNLLAISRQSAALTTIIHVRPGKGIVGDTVTIEGSGFSPTPAQNAVSFNGTAATVVSSSFTEIVTSGSAGARATPTMR